MVATGSQDRTLKLWDIMVRARVRAAIRQAVAPLQVGGVLGADLGSWVFVEALRVYTRSVRGGARIPRLPRRRGRVLSRQQSRALMPLVGHRCAGPAMGGAGIVDVRAIRRLAVGLGSSGAPACLAHGRGRAAGRRDAVLPGGG